jgi:hypothetical protein
MFVVATHHKCASNPLTRVLKEYSKYKGTSFLAIEGGQGEEIPEKCRILVISNATHDFARRFAQHRPVHIFRNPLDIVVSAYYSHLRTHDTKYWPQLAVQRKVLERQNKDQGMISTAIFLARPDFNAHVMGPLAALRRWDFDDSNFINIRMEDLVKNPFAVMNNVSAELFGPDAEAFFKRMSFENLSGGREVGQVDNFSHFRSGKPGQWRNELPRDLAVTLGETFRPMLERFYPQTLRDLDEDHHVAKARVGVAVEKSNFFRRFMHRGCPTRNI